MNSSIGILGTGIAGLHLALFLQQQHVPVTLYGEQSLTNRPPARLPSLVIRSATTTAYERELGVNHWDGTQADLTSWQTNVGGPRQISYSAAFERPLSCVDMRLYEVRLLEDFVMWGGQYTVGHLAANDLEILASIHPLLVIATGRGGLNSRFPRNEARSPFTEPQRLLCGGLFEGEYDASSQQVRLNVTPGVGEVFEIPCLTAQGRRLGLAVEAVPGGPLESFVRTQFTMEEIAPALIAVLREFAPETAVRINPSKLRPTGKLDFMQGSLTPIARQPFIPLANERYALAIGDALAVHDPVRGQGANVASACAWALGEQIVAAQGVYSQAFCEAAGAKLWEVLRSPLEMTNSALGPPSNQFMALTGACATSASVASAWLNLIHEPASQWAVLEKPEGVAEFLEGWSELGYPR